MFDKVISSSTIQAIKDAMTPVAEALGKGAEYTWVVLIKQQYVVAVGDFIGFVVGMVAGLLILKWTIIMYKTDRYGTNPGWFFSGAFALGGIGMSMYALYDGLAHIINPDFYVLQFLISAVTGAQ